MEYIAKVLPHPDGSGDSMVEIPEDLWIKAQSFGWRAGDRYFITRDEDSLHLHRLTPETMKPVKTIQKSRFKRELSKHLNALKENEAIGIGESEYVLVKASMYYALMTTIAEMDDGPEGVTEAIRSV